MTNGFILNLRFAPENGERYSDWASPIVTDYFNFSDYLFSQRETLKTGEFERSTSAAPEDFSLVADGISLYLSNL